MHSVGYLTRHPSCWTPPTLPPTLPEGEAVRPWPLEIVGAAAAYPPMSAPGFQAAARLGMLPPPPPATVPQPVPGLSSWDRMRLAIVLCFGVFGVGIVLANAMDGLWALLLCAVPFTSGAWLLYSTEKRDSIEAAAGYTSTQGRTGLWRLANDGRVLREPDRSVPPPGWYPSPYYPGILQRWEGPGWKPLPEYWWRREHLYFRAPDHPFL